MAAEGDGSEGHKGLSWKTRLMIAASNLVFDYSRRSDGTINRRLMSFFDPKSPPCSNPTDGVTSSDTTVDPSRDLWFRLYVPSSASADDSKLPLVVFFHGGGFTLCAPDSKPFEDLCRRLAREIPAVVVSVNYRLAPEHRCPAPYDDGFEFLRFVDSARSDSVLPRSADLGRCFVAGDSAGGNIAHHVTLRAIQFPGLERLRIVGLVALQPFFGGEERTASELRLTRAPFLNEEFCDWLWRAFLPEGSDRDHEAANVFGTGGTGTHQLEKMRFPAAMVVVGGFDPLQDRQRRYSEGLKRCGKEVRLVEYPNAIHGFYSFPELPECGLVINEVRDFIQKH